MFRILTEEKWISIAMLTTLALSIAGRVIIWILYQNMIRETENMSATKNKSLKQCKLKFVNCYQLNRGVANVPVFVDKFLNRLSLGPFRYHTIYHLSGQMMLLSVLFAGVGVCRGIIAGRFLGELLPFYIISFLGMYLFFSVSAVTDIKDKRRVLKINLVDYLENHMINKLGGVERDLEIVDPGKKERAMDVITGGKATVPGRPSIEADQAAVITREERRELEQLLREFLTS